MRVGQVPSFQTGKRPWQAGVLEKIISKPPNFPTFRPQNHETWRFWAVKIWVIKGNKPGARCFDFNSVDGRYPTPADMAGQPSQAPPPSYPQK